MRLVVVGAITALLMAPCGAPAVAWGAPTAAATKPSTKTGKKVGERPRRRSKAAKRKGTGRRDRAARKGRAGRRGAATASGGSRRRGKRVAATRRRAKETVRRGSKRRGRAAVARRGSRGQARRVRGGSRRRGPRYPSVLLYSVNRRDSMWYRPYDRRGRPRRSEYRRLCRFLRDKRGRVGRVHHRLARLLYQVARHYRGQRLEVVSGYRARPRNPRSPHKEGRALDFRVQGVSNQALRDHLRRTYTRIGVGYYPNSVFVHLDVRKKRSVFWIDYSGPGQSPEYSENPEGDLRSGLVDRRPPPAARVGGAVEDAVVGADSPASRPAGPAPASAPRLDGRDLRE